MLELLVTQAAERLLQARADILISDQVVIIFTCNFYHLDPTRSKLLHSGLFCLYEVELESAEEHR